MPRSKPDARQLRECESLMLKARYYLGTDWEFRRMIDYIRERPEAMAEAGERLHAELYSDNMEDLL